MLKPIRSTSRLVVWNKDLVPWSITLTNIKTQSVKNGIEFEPEASQPARQNHPDSRLLKIQGLRKLFISYYGPGAILGPMPLSHPRILSPQTSEFHDKIQRMVDAV